MSLCGVRIGKGSNRSELQGQEIQNKVHHKKAWLVLENTWLCPNLYRGGKNA